MTTSPPPKHNFHETPVITQRPALVPGAGRGGRACRHLTRTPAATTRTSRTTSTPSRSRTTPPGWACGCSWDRGAALRRACSSATRSTATSITRPSTRPRGTLEPQLGTVNTVVLITSSFTVALAYHAIKRGKTEAGARRCWSFTIVVRLRLPRDQVRRVRAQVPRGALPGKWYTLRRRSQARARTSTSRSTSSPPACTPSTSSSGCRC